MTGLAVGTAVARATAPPPPPVYYAPPPACREHLRWDPYLGRYVRVARCY